MALAERMNTNWIMVCHIMPASGLSLVGVTLRRRVCSGVSDQGQNCQSATWFKDRHAHTAKAGGVISMVGRVE